METLDRRHATGFSWANAHRVQDDHNFEVFRIYAQALAELERRGLWLAPEQKQQAGLTPGHPDTAQRDCEVQEQEEADAKNR